MQAEQLTNLFKMDYGTVPGDRSGQFTFKIFPNVGRLTEAEIEHRAAKEQRHTPKRNPRTRAEVPLGAAGWFIFQARTLLAGIEHHTVWDERSFVGFTDFDTRDDGSLVVPDTPASNTDIGQSKEERVLRWMGSIMTAALHSAFACELVLKAITFTYTDEAQQTHDLHALLNSVPDASRSRILADYQQMADLFERKRLTFGAWRYFEPNAGEGGIKALIDVAAARDLGRAARVLLDEAKVVGLGASLRFKGTRHTENTDHSRVHRDYYEIRLTGTESPPSTQRPTTQSPLPQMTVTPPGVTHIAPR